MSKGKQHSDSKSAYDNETNQRIDNRIFEFQEKHIPENKKAYHTVNFFTKYFTNTENKVSFTRNPSSVNDKQAREKFLALVQNYESNAGLKLCESSKSELLYRFLDFTEKTNSIIHLKDDAQQFLVYRFLFPDVMKLYFYKMFYPGIFDFDIVCSEHEKTIKFKSDYIEENFNDIFKQINMLCYTIVYDALIIAVEDCAVKHISSMKRYSVTLTPSSGIHEIAEDFEKQIKKNSDARTPLVKKFAPCLFFFAKHHGNLQPQKELPARKISNIITYDAFYTGNRSIASRAALISTYSESSSVLNEIPHPFTKLLNLYHINKNSCLYDLNILKNNVQFMPYAFDGILAKYHISQMISDNNDKLQSTLDPSLNLSSVYNNPNCIICNISARDYEMLDYVISRIVKTFESYYLTKQVLQETAETESTGKKKKTKLVKDEKTRLICRIIDIVDQTDFTSAIAKIIPEFTTFDTNNIDYDMVRGWVNPFSSDDGLPG